jgi:hypothetical protein
VLCKIVFACRRRSTHSRIHSLTWLSSKQRFKGLCEIHKFSFEEDKLEPTDAVPTFDKATLPAVAADNEKGQEVKVAVATSKPKKVYKRKPKTEAAKMEGRPLPGARGVK